MEIEEVKKFQVINDEKRILRRFVEGFSSVPHETIKEMSYNTLFDAVDKIVRTRRHNGK